MRELPRGTVTFLFTDIEGSTKLLRELGDAYADALAEHRRLLRKAFSAQGGVEVDTQGDAFFYAFADAAKALQAAQDGQQALDACPIPVRMGLHTGEPQLTAEGYVGLDVHMGARVAACAHGGQVVLSRETQTQLHNAFPLLDLGEHRLKDFAAPVWIYQLGNERFPPLKTISNTNLPRPPSSFVGRAEELNEVVSLVHEGVRLVTLSGPGGSGKTRLAIEAGSELVSAFRAGVFWVGLAALREPALVTETIAQTLGAKEELAVHIGQRQLLLLLDNLEQVIEAAPALSQLLSTCPNLQLLVTSRELLRVQGEVDYAVPPLAQPEAVELFCARARLEPDRDIAELCRRLDHLPLALELAAARARALSPAQILERLSQRLDLLRGGRDADPRQQTLRAAIDWSYELLGVEEQRLFARLSVFAGGCALEAAQRVTDAELDVLQSLVEKSLLRHSGERFWMLETIREYALARLEELGEAEELRRRHALFFLAFSELAEEGLRGAGERTWLEQLDREHDNLRAALAYSTETGDSEAELRIAGALWRFWESRGHLAEGLRRFEAALARPPGDHPAIRGKALHGAFALAFRQGRLDEAEAFAAEGLELSEALGDQAGLARALTAVGIAAFCRGDHTRARALYERGLGCARRAEDGEYAAVLVNNLGEVALSEGDHERAVGLFAEGLSLSRANNAPNLMALSRMNLALAALRRGELGRAEREAEQGLSLSRDLSHTWYTSGCALVLATVARQRGRVASAARLLGAAEVLVEDAGGMFMGSEGELYRENVARLRERLGDAAFESARAAGRASAEAAGIAYLPSDSTGSHVPSS